MANTESVKTPPAHPPRGERRYVTVLFSDVVGSLQHSESLEAEDYAEVLQRFRRAADEIVERHGGIVARAQGDGVLAVFGYGEAREDNGRRATEAALQLHQSAARMTAGQGTEVVTLQLHSGIHAGLAYVSEGDMSRGRVDLAGVVPNTASRLSSLAGVGEILVSEATLGPHAHFFCTTPRRLTLRGLSQSLDVLRVDGRATVNRRIDAAAQRGTVPFVGRTAALDLLLSEAARTREGTAGTVVVTGEAGIGKTRLIDEFQLRLDRSAFVTLQGYCESYLGAEPLQPFMQVVRNALGWGAGVATEVNEAAVVATITAMGDDLSADTAGALRAMTNVPGNAATLSLDKRIDAIVALVKALTRHRAAVLVVDDWQWADDSSRQALQLLRAQALPLFIVLSSRSSVVDEAELSGSRSLTLLPLDVPEGEGAIGAWLPEADPFVVQEIYRQAGGSPLYIEELCYAAAATGDLRAVPRGAGVAWLNALVASRLSRLPEEAAECLRAASVAGNVFDRWLIERLVGPERVPVIDALTRSDFLMEAAQPGMLRFKHGLTRDAVYATVEPVHRRSLHTRVAAALEAAAQSSDASEWLEELSYHFDAAGDMTRAARYAEAAGDKALAAMALDRARAQYLTALHALDGQTLATAVAQRRWCGIAQKLGVACVFDPLDISELIERFERAAVLARLVGDDNVIARAEYWLGYINYAKGQPRRAVRHCEAALALARASCDERLVNQVEATLGQSLASAGRYDAALPLLARAVDSKRKSSRPGSSTAIGSAYTLARTGYTLGDLGRFNDAHGLFDEAFHLLGGAQHAVLASIHELLCVVHLWQGRWEDARAEGENGAAIALRCRSRFNTAMGRALGACGWWAASHDAAALRTLRESTHWIEVRGGAVSTSLNYGWLVEAYTTAGQVPEARAAAARLLMRARAEDRHGEAMGCRALARLAASAGQHARAQRYLDQADRAADVRGSMRERAVNGLARASLAAAAGRLSEARWFLDGAVHTFETMEMDWHLGAARELRLTLDA